MVKRPIETIHSVFRIQIIYFQRHKAKQNYASITPPPFPSLSWTTEVEPHHSLDPLDQFPNNVIRHRTIALHFVQSYPFLRSNN